MLDIEGKPTGEISLPTVFETRLRLDIIQKASVAQQSHRFQPQGRNLMAGKRTTAEGFGVGRGISRVPRIGGHGPLSGTAAFAPGTVGGRMAFPPVTAKKIAKQINRKERRLALRSAIAATASDEIVRQRGVGVWDDVLRVRRSKRIKSGRRVHAVGPLIVVGDDKTARKALRNFEGVNVIRADELSVEMLAPGTHPGRLTIWSESAVKKIAEKG